jgi:hypothetical protein
MPAPEMPAVEIVETAETLWGLPLQPAGWPLIGHSK